MINAPFSHAIQMLFSINLGLRTKYFKYLSRTATKTDSKSN